MKIAKSQKIEKSSIIVLSCALTVATSSASASSTVTFDEIVHLIVMNSRASRELVLSKEQLSEIGVSSLRLFDKNGNQKTLEAQELVKVRIHEEANKISFDSFDDYSVVVSRFDGEQPRNVGNDHGN